MKKKYEKLPAFIRNILVQSYAILFFFKNIIDFKFDFPFPPRPFTYRLFLPSFWKTFFHIYMVRKKDEKKFNNNVKTLWSEKSMRGFSYEKWLLKIFNTQHGTVVSRKAFDLFSNKSTINVLEAGCGSGGAAACLLMHVLDKRFPGGVLNNNFDTFNYFGIDLNPDRVETANTFVPMLFKHYQEKLNLSISNGDLENLSFEDRQFDLTFVPSVLERIDNNSIESVISEIARVTQKGIYVCDFFDHYPLGYPRNHKVQAKFFRKFGFELTWHEYLITNTKMKNQCELHTFFERRNAD